MFLQRKEKQCGQDAIQRRMQMASVAGGKQHVEGPKAEEVPAKLFLVAAPPAKTTVTPGRRVEDAPIADSPYTLLISYDDERPSKAQLWPDGLQMGGQRAMNRVVEMPSAGAGLRQASGVRALLDPAQWLGHPLFAWLRAAV